MNVYVSVTQTRLRQLARILLLLLFSMGLGAPRAAAQQEDEPLYRQLTGVFKKDYLSLGVLLQTVADFQIDRSLPGNNGYSVANFRLSLSGTMDQQFSYFLQTNFAGSPAILDARLSYRFSPEFAADVGQFKAPFSREFLTSAAGIDFVNRAQAITALAPGRQIGMQVRLGDTLRTVGVQLGAFNGNGTRPNGNDNNNLLYAARLAATRTVGDPDKPRGRTGVGLNVAFSRDNGSSFGNGFATDFFGDRALLGADARVVRGKYLFSGEVIYGWLDPEDGPTRNPWGLQATVGYKPQDKVQVLLRWDGFDPDAAGGRQDFLVLGLNVWPTSVTEFQVNYLVDPDEAAIDRHQVLINFQFGF